MLTDWQGGGVWQWNVCHSSLLPLPWRWSALCRHACVESPCIVLLIVSFVTVVKVFNFLSRQKSFFVTLLLFCFFFFFLFPSFLPSFLSFHFHLHLLSLHLLQLFLCGRLCSMFLLPPHLALFLPPNAVAVCCLSPSPSPSRPPSSSWIQRCSPAPFPSPSTDS